MLRCQLAEARATEARLHHQHTVLKYVIEHVPHTIFWKNREGRFLGGNRRLVEDLQLGSIDDILGKTDEQVARGTREEIDYFVRMDREVMESGQPRLDFEETQHRADGSLAYLLTSKVPLREASGKVTGMLGIYADITQRKQMEVELLQAKEAALAAACAKGDFLTMMSHELRTPLALILGPLASLLSSRGEPLPPQVRADLERVQRNARRLHRLVDDVLDHQKIEAGKMRLDWEAVDVAELCEDLVDGARAAAERGGVHLSIQTDPELGAAPLDRRKFEKIMLNLLGNALKFTPSGGAVAVSLQASGDHFELSVEDTGPGIPAEKRYLLFQRFQQIDASRTRKHEGTGIGLSLVKDLTELMGGTVGVTSKPGEGSRFFVKLPRAPDHLFASKGSCGQRSAAPGEIEEDAPRTGPSPPCPPATPGAAQALGGEGYLEEPTARAASASPSAAAQAIERAPRLLIAEDNPDMGAYLAELLGAEYEVELVTNGREALARVEAQRPDVIVSDVMMPEMDGFELVSRLKKDAERRDIPILLLTARASHREAVQGIEGGADDYLSKPFDPAELKARVRAAERLHRAYAELAAKNRELEATLRRLSETQEELVQAGKMAAVGTLIAGLSHEMNNPLAIILMSAQLLLQRRREGREALNEATLDKGLRTIEAQSTRCSQLVRALLEYAHKKPTAAEPCDMRAALNRVLELAAPQAREQRVQLEAQHATALLPTVRASQTQLDSALLNVIGNAIDAAAGGGAVVVRARPLAKHDVSGVELDVRDTGYGIDAADLSRIFEPFFTTKPPGKGTGLGLSLTRRFFEQHGGNIRIESEPGKGTTVSMWLPAMTAEASSRRDGVG
ncbi:ATP-binding protein [Sorangium sp. So ce1128]